ncbi:recombinase family protein [Trichocoleus sp. FACHB-90]|uniref:recombinase family protein n=1 Tax=Cyanophyceae TaxID=3028117 RepID=UPI001683767C|nr:recombinase family protein [Trichocoleus sp. FACHB-90]MBD1929468.1 recombinase family protein [Trichocoleus sp. FACHB-90]
MSSIFGANDWSSRLRFAEFERQIIKERTFAGLATARARGRKSGRKEQHSDKKILTAIKLADDSPEIIEEICHSFGISKATYYRRRMNLYK